MEGILYICGTPIGNIKDITLRCLETLNLVDIIIAEDTRVTLKLLNHYNIKKPLESYHQNNQAQKTEKVVDMLKKGKKVALVSDAGMPLISDPGEELVKACYNENIEIKVVPGATAITSALVLSGFKTRSYCFEGFLPSNKKFRKSVFERLKQEDRTIVLYETPHDLNDTLKEIKREIGNRNIAVIREITKKYEDVHRGNIEEIIKYFEGNKPKGEIVLIIEGENGLKNKRIKGSDISELSIEELFEKYINKGVEEKKAIKLISKEVGLSKREVYRKIKIK